jgi:hypothetical protein
VLFALIFLAAGLFNAYTALREPAAYHAYAEWAVLPFYRRFINGFFSEHTRAIIVVIAVGQLTIAALLTRSDRMRTIGVIGGIIFLAAITPLGIGSAFPSTVLMAAALILMQRRLSQQGVHAEV